MKKIILDLCGGTGAWSKPYLDAGYDVRLVTLPMEDVFSYRPPENVYGILAAPTCAHFSFARTKSKTPRNLEKAMQLVWACQNIIWQCQYKLSRPSALKTTLKFWALENPKGFLQSFLGKPALEFQPWEFGDQYQKPTHLWGNFNIPKKSPVKLSQKEKIKFGKNTQTLPKYEERDLFNPDGYEYNERCGQDKRQVRRSITPPKFAQAFFKANK